jgi:hypothetical protein
MTGQHIVEQPPQTQITCSRCGPRSGHQGFFSVIDPPSPTVDYCYACFRTLFSGPPTTPKRSTGG